jgi:hypothetical protein
MGDQPAAEGTQVAIGEDLPDAGAGRHRVCIIPPDGHSGAIQVNIQAQAESQSEKQVQGQLQLMAQVQHQWQAQQQAMWQWVEQSQAQWQSQWQFQAQVLLLLVGLRKHDPDCHKVWEDLQGGLHGRKA